MTAVELIIVVGIFSVMASTVFFNYGKFQAKVEVKNLANEVALKAVEAQKSAVSGKWNTSFGNNKPAYGVVFNVTAPTQFAYFADFDNSNTCTGTQCSPPFAVGGEVQDVVTMTRGSIPASGLEVTGSGCPATVSALTVVFRRPNSSAVISSSPAHGCTPTNVAVTISSPASLSAKIYLYASGRVQVN